MPYDGINVNKFHNHSGTSKLAASNTLAYIHNEEGATANFNRSASAIFPLNAGDYVQVFVCPGTAGTPGTTTYSWGTGTMMTGYLVSTL